MLKTTTTAVLGAGTIGMSWAALFAAAGHKVAVYDPAPEAERAVRHFLKGVAQDLAELGFKDAGDDSGLRFTTDPEDAVNQAEFIQENVPERLDVKQHLYQSVVSAMQPDALLCTSTSGLTLSLLQAGLGDPSRLLLAHPFNPPHLIPLVELMANTQTAPDVLPRARDFYEGLGKVPIELKREMPGHIANRLQAVLWREVISLAQQGVASLEDIDKAVVFGPGLRWAAEGPTTLFHLGGGEGGIAQFCEHLGNSLQQWWASDSEVRLDEQTVRFLADEMERTGHALSRTQLATERDRLILSYLSARKTITLPPSAES